MDRDQSKSEMGLDHKGTCYKTITFDDDYFGNGTTSPYRELTIDRTFHKCRLPICQDEINANPELQNQQNPGY